MLSCDITHAADISGSWFRCYSEGAQSLEIHQSEDKYLWLHEWGPASAANGQVNLTDNGDLELKGCKSYRGEYEKGWDLENPPVYLKLPHSFIDNPNPATNKALRNSLWIKTTSPDWAKLEKHCAVLNALDPQPLPWSPDNENAGISGYPHDKGTITKSDTPRNPPKFEDYLVRKIYSGKPASPKINSDPEFRNMRTKIRESVKNGANFAGHYNLVFTGCGFGATCLTAIADVESGDLYSSEAVGSVDTYNIDLEDQLIEYRKDSKLLKVIGLINADDAFRGVSYFVWEHNKFRRIKFVHRTSN